MKRKELKDFKTNQINKAAVKVIIKRYRQHLNKRQESSLRIQSLYRQHRATTRYQKDRHATIRLQLYIRRKQAKQLLQKLKKATISTVLEEIITN